LMKRNFGIRRNFMFLPPYKIKMVEPIRVSARKWREQKIKQVGLNPFLLSSDDITIDLLTDSGTNAMSENQWAAMMLGDETYAGATSFDNFKKAVRDILGFPYCIPVHQGRGAEHVFDALFVKEGSVSVGNAFFDTTQAHIDYRGGRTIDCTIAESKNTSSPFLFKGNADIKKIERALKENRGRVSYILLTVTCNSVGGQPVSLTNIISVSKLAKKYNTPFFMDIARFAQNAYFIKEREKKYKNWPVQKIAREMMKYADGALMSAKKDALVNMGGFIALRSRALYQKLVPFAILFEGFPTYGGMSGRDMEAVAVGLREGVDEDFLRSHIEQVKYLGEGMRKAGIPVLLPYGGHAVYLDMKKFFPRVKPDNFPGQAFCAELYIESGVRAVEIGGVLAGRDPATGKNRKPPLDLVRLAIPRRVYTKDHLDYVIEGVKKVWQRRQKIRGVRFVYEPPVLRHFQAKFRWV